MMSVAAIVSMCAFTPNVKPPTSFKYYGDIKPLNYFDPLNFLTPTKSNEKISDEAIKYVREAELQHGRMAMLAAVAFPIIEKSMDKSIAIDYLSDSELLYQSPFWLGMLVFETVRMCVGWQNPFFAKNKDYQPGNVFSYDVDKVTDFLYESELSNGRIAMLAVSSIMGSELLTGQSFF
jgi:hypothetical protein